MLGTVLEFETETLIMKTRSLYIFLFFFFVSAPTAQSQSTEKIKSVVDDDFFTYGDVLIKDTIPYKILEEVVIDAKPTRKHKRRVRRYNRLMRKVLKVYPYARIANERINTIESNMEKFEVERDRKRFVAMQEEKLRKEFEGDLKKLTFSEGRILIKLIDRETGNTSYELIKQLRGNLSAFFWQSLAKLFGSDLKSEYDPDDEDKMIENIIVRIESGELKPKKI